MERLGHGVLDEHALDLRPGDVIATPRWKLPGHVILAPGNEPPGIRVVPEDQLDLRGRAPLSVMDPATGLYDMVWGPLPYSRAEEGVERIEVVRVTRANPPVH